jgi:hypothetical protein
MKNQSALFAIILAIIVGLGIGGFLFYRIVNGGKANVSSSAQTTATAVPSVSSESTPTALHPPAEADALKSDSSGTTQTSTVAPKVPRQHARVSIESNDSASPKLMQSAGSSAAIASTDLPSPIAPATPTAHATTNPSRRRAVQESEDESPSVPSSTLPNTATAPAVPANNEPVSASDRAPSASSVKRLYNGPQSGVATWTGKLEKNGTLTITGGTPSMGVLAGAGLPGVPVHVTIDQANLGFVETPSAANGYRRLILKSHGGHDKIVIRWTVVQ